MAERCDMAVHTSALRGDQPPTTQHIGDDVYVDRNEYGEVVAVEVLDATSVVINGVEVSPFPGEFRGSGDDPARDDATEAVPDMDKIRRLRDYYDTHDSITGEPIRGDETASGRPVKSPPAGVHDVLRVHGIDPATYRPPVVASDHTEAIRAWSEGRRAAEVNSDVERLQAALDETAESNDQLRAERDSLAADAATHRRSASDAAVERGVALLLAQTRLDELHAAWAERDLTRAEVARLQAALDLSRAGHSEDVERLRTALGAITSALGPHSTAGMRLSARSIVRHALDATGGDDAAPR